MYRLIEQELLTWKSQAGRKPLLLRGARQIGKSYILEQFGKAHFSNYVLINFEFQPKFRQCFSQLDPTYICNAIAAMTGQDIVPGKTLLILDEVQECEQAILALRYFKEMLPQLHVVAAGSLLEFVLNADKFQMPVGRVQTIYMKPCTFEEYLIASDNQKLLDYINEVTIESGINQGIHLTLLNLLREFFFLGGMPEVISHYLEHRDILGCQTIQESIHEFYRNDFGKYDRRIKIERLQAIYDKTPGLIAQKFQYTKIDPHVQARDLKPALKALTDASLILPIYHTSAAGLPLQSTINERLFKLLFIDVGLISNQSSIDFNTFMNEHIILLNRGALAEQFVGQELLAYQKSYVKPQLYYWQREQRGSVSEVDYITNIGAHIVPIEVKAGKTGRLKSLQIFLNEKNIDIGVRVSQSQLSFNQRILSIPLYMMSQLTRLYDLARN